MTQSHVNDAIHWYMNELTSRVVAKSGIARDRFHIGKIVLQSFKDDPHFVAQIDGGTGESETNGSLLKRSIQCAISLKKMGLKQGDVMVFMAPNHLDIAVPFYAALYLGIIIAPLDRKLTVFELKKAFALYEPKVIVCQSENVSDIQATFKLLDLDANIITFDKQNEGICFNDLLLVDQECVEKFKPDDFNPEDSIAMILPTSGTTGFPKGAAITYKTLMISDSIWSTFTKFPTPTRMWLTISSLIWASAISNFIKSPIVKYTRLQTSKIVTEDHVRYLINTYRPTITALSTTMVAQLLTPGKHGPCDLSSFDVLIIGGSHVYKELMREVQVASPRTTVINIYGMTELAGLGFLGDGPLGSCGRPSRVFQYKLINLETKETIEEPNVIGELWIKGPAMFKEYYNNPEETKQAFAEDRWLKTGDMFYRDEHWNYYCAGRIKMLILYNMCEVCPAELEDVIREHPGVRDVVVTSIPDSKVRENQLPVACIIPRSGHSPAAQEIQDLVKAKLSDPKQLRGGVVFMDSFPLKASAKIDYKKLTEMVREMKTKQII